MDKDELKAELEEEISEAIARRDQAHKQLAAMQALPKSKQPPQDQFDLLDAQLLDEEEIILTATEQLNSLG